MKTKLYNNNSSFFKATRLVFGAETPTNLEADKASPNEASDSNDYNKAVEAGNTAIKNAMKTADQLSGGPETKFEAKPFTKEELERKIGNGSKELLGKKKAEFKDIIKQAKDTIKSNSPDHKISHGDTQEFSIDDTNYVYLRDESKKGSSKNRLFEKK